MERTAKYIEILRPPNLFTMYSGRVLTWVLLWSDPLRLNFATLLAMKTGMKTKPRSWRRMRAWERRAWKYDGEIRHQSMLGWKETMLRFKATYIKNSFICVKIHLHWTQKQRLQGLMLHQCPPDLWQLVKYPLLQMDLWRVIICK